jgi:hypothetical protein
MREQLCMQGLGVAACFLLECCYLIYMYSLLPRMTQPICRAPFSLRDKYVVQTMLMCMQAAAVLASSMHRLLLVTRHHDQQHPSDIAKWPVANILQNSLGYIEVYRNIGYQIVLTRSTELAPGI